MNPDVEIWDNAADAWAKKVTGPGSLRSVHHKQAIDELLPDVKGKQVLDAGCGDGVFAKYLSQLGASVEGIDGSSKMVAIAKEKYSGIKFQTVDLLGPIPYPDNSFDLVFSNMVLMHLSDVSVFFKEANRILKAQGTLVFSVLHPAFNFPTMNLYKSWWDKLLFRKPSGLVYDYFQADKTRRFEGNVNQVLTHYHRTLEEYSKQIADKGFVITRILEPHKLSPEFLQEKPKMEYTTRLPRFIFFKLQKT